MDLKRHGALPVLGSTSEHVVPFYVTQETHLPVKFQGNHQVVTVTIVDPGGNSLEKPALRITFPKDQSIKELAPLVAFGSDPRRHVQLPLEVASSMHCGIYAQSNSGPQVWVVEDESTQGTRVEDEETQCDKLVKIVHGRRQATPGLQKVHIGPYSFEFRIPVIAREVQRREDWFRLNRPVPVTRSMLDRQLGGLQHDWLRLNLIGEGGYGKVYRYMEKRTALYVAMKEEKMKLPHKELKVKKEIYFMKTLRHPYLVDILYSGCDGMNTEPTQFTVMPLYLGNLWTLLVDDLDTETKEQILIQILEGVLHRDLKPDNIFWVTKSPMVVKVGDYGLATSLADCSTLFERCGTAAYMAPEMSKRNGPQTPAVDVFSLGAIGYAILEHPLVSQGWYRKGQHQYNRVFDNVATSPPRLYAGLVQSMMATNPEDRPSLDVCIDVVRRKHYNWVKGTPLVPVQTAAPTTVVQQDTQMAAVAPEQQENSPDRARAFARKRGLPPIAVGKRPEHEQSPQQAPAKRDKKRRQAARIQQAPKGPLEQAVAVGTPKPEETAPKQGIKLRESPLPPFNIRISFLSRERLQAKKTRLHSILDSIPEEPVEVVLGHPNRRRGKHVTFENEPTIIRYTDPANASNASPSTSRNSSSHSNSATRTRRQRPNNTRRIPRRPREHAPTLDIHRVGTGRVQKTPLHGLKDGVIDIAKGAWQFSKGVGFVTYNTVRLSGQGMAALRDYMRGNDLAPALNAGLLLNNNTVLPNNADRQLVAGMRERSFGHEARRQRQRAGNGPVDEEMEDVRGILLGGGRRRGRIEGEGETG